VTDRRHERIALALEVEFRTVGNFLVAYSTNLSKGGMFIETEEPLPVGATVTLRFAVPGGPPFDVQAVVAWVQAWNTEEAKKGMGVRFEHLEARHGEQIDRLVESFRGLRIMVMAHDPAARSALTRAVRLVLATADIVEVADGDAAEAALARECDLALVELDIGLEDVLGADPDVSAPGGSSEGLLALRLCKARQKPTPVIALAQSEARRALARELGADVVMGSSPAFHDLQSTLVRLLGRPLAVRA
jgi:uncharacterized protein (TIGR02266 family)